MSAMIRLITLSGIFVIGAFMIGCGTVSNQTLNSVILPVGLLRVEGNTIKDSLNQTIHLKGFCLTNGVYTNLSVSSIDPKFKLTAPEYQEIKSSGANVVRFYLQYHWLDDTEAFFAYMDEQLALIAATNLKAILSLHYFGINESGDFYKGSVSQPDINALKEFWKKISNKYVTNNVIAGYDLLNEPSCSTTFTETTLYSHYENIIEELRNSGDEHIIFISDPVNKFDNSSDGHFLAEAFKKVTDNNVVYQFHWYKPVEFTHQTVYNDPFFELGASYPLVSYRGISPDGGYRGIWGELESNENKIKNTNGNWQTYTGSWVNLKQHIRNDGRLADDLSLFGVSLFCGGTNGEIEIDNITLNCRLTSQPGNVWEIVLPNSNFDYATKYKNNDHALPSAYPANWSIATDLSPAQYTAELKNGALYFKASAPSTYATWKHETNKHTTYLTISENYEYQIQAEVKIQNNTIGDFYAGFEFYEALPTIYDKQYSATRITGYYGEWGISNHVPLYCGEWGVADPSKALNGYPNAPEQQVAWIDDMASILRTKGLHWTYHDYKNYDNLGFGAFDTNAKNEIKQALQRAFQ